MEEIKMMKDKYEGGGNSKPKQNAQASSKMVSSGLKRKKQKQYTTHNKIEMESQN